MMRSFSVVKCFSPILIRHILHSKKERRIQRESVAVELMNKNSRKKFLKMLSVLTAMSLGTYPAGAYMQAHAAPVIPVGNVSENSVDMENESVMNESQTDENAEDGHFIEEPSETEISDIIPLEDNDLNGEVKVTDDLTDPGEKVINGSAGNEVHEVIEEIHIVNPRYHNMKNIPEVSGSGKTEWNVKEVQSLEDALQDAGRGLKESLLSQNASIKVSFGGFDAAGSMNTINEDISRYKDYLEGGEPSEKNICHVKLAAQLLEAACTHTGVPEEGDFLSGNVVSAEYAYHADGDNFYLEFTNIRYLSSQKDLNTFSEEVGKIIQENSMNEKGQYAKVKSVYDYIHKSLSFNRNDGNCSAYGALTDGSASMQGYSNLAYYMLNRLGIDTRIITGGENEWLITRLADRYYIIDPAEDSAAANKDSYKWLLKGSASMDKSHSSDWQYCTDTFSSEHPLNEMDYVPSSVTLDQTDIKLTVGSQVSLKASSTDGSKIKYSSSDSSIVTVTKDGLLVAVKEGVAEITAEGGDGKAICTVHVVNEYTVSVSSKDDVTQYVSGSGKYKDNDVVTISAIRETRDGYLFKEWDFSASVKFLDGGSSKDYRVSFYMPDEDVEAVAIYEEIPVTGILLSKEKIRMMLGDVENISWSVEPSNAFTGYVRYESSNEKIATVDEKGRITATGPGTAVITISSGNIKSSCEVQVSGEEYTIQVTGRNTSGTVKTQDKKVTAGDSITISVPNVESYGYKFEKWVSDPADITYTDGYSSSSIKTSFLMPDCNLSMTANYTEIKVESVVLKNDEISISAGKTYKLKPEVTVSPSNALKKALSYSSSDETVAKVSSAGVITGVGDGHATVTVTCGDITASCRVTVKGSSSTASGTEYLRLNASSLKMYVGRTYKLSLTSRNAGTITFRSDNSSIARVDSAGTVTGVAAGNCTITAISESGRTSDTVKVTVVELATNSTAGNASTPEGQMLLYKAAAARYRANADKIRADALRNGMLGEVAENESVSQETGENQETDLNRQSMRSTSSQPTGDSSWFLLWIVLGSISGGLSIFMAFRGRIREKKRLREPLVEKVEPGGNNSLNYTEEEQ